MLLSVVIGCCVGSFLCLSAQRIPQGHSIISPRSHCVNCHHFLTWYELIPLLSICLQRFRCRSCHVPLPQSYFLAELACGGIFVWFFHYAPSTDPMLLFWILSAFLLSLMDCFYLFIDSRILYLIWIILWCYWFLTGHFQFTTVLILSIVSSLLIFYATDYLGSGDSLVVWCWSGQLLLVQLLYLVLIASALGICFMLCTHFFFQKKITKLPFLPFLSVALLVVQHIG
ncbi:prepilin peptidase [Enterococcus durans]|uniref:prepilin peptidase n=1 Tax=Enterococcus durans TaxID=53345 RepID=UPI0011942AD7|nr:A24 family peptidase [uncultured Enterococcus sp.]TVT12183.1 prepilin peptidase [Enterococcus durans]